MSVDALTWIAIGLLVAQSGTFSGLNLALFGVSALRLQTMAGIGNAQAQRMLELRNDSNFLLTTILWGNVATNVLLTLLSDSVLTGAVAFVFSTFVITLGGEIFPQAYFSRHALRVVGLTAPILRIYQILLYPIAKPTALLLDAWLGKETIAYIPEQEIREVLLQHVKAAASDVDHVEGMGAVNFLAMDDVMVNVCGEPIAPESVVHLPIEHGRPVWPAFTASPDDPFLRQVQASGRRWVLIAGDEGPPVLALDASAFLRAAMFRAGPVDPMAFCSAPVTLTDDRTLLGDAIVELRSDPQDHVIDEDVIVLWGDQRRIITGANILGRLLRGIVRPLTQPT